MIIKAEDTGDTLMPPEEYFIELATKLAHEAVDKIMEKMKAEEEKNLQ